MIDRRFRTCPKHGLKRKTTQVYITRNNSSIRLKEVAKHTCKINSKKIIAVSEPKQSIVQKGISQALEDLRNDVHECNKKIEKVLLKQQKIQNYIFSGKNRNSQSVQPVFNRQSSISSKNYENIQPSHHQKNMDFYRMSKCSEPSLVDSSASSYNPLLRYFKNKHRYQDHQQSKIINSYYNNRKPSQSIPKVSRHKNSPSIEELHLNKNFLSSRCHNYFTFQQQEQRGYQLPNKALGSITNLPNNSQMFSSGCKRSLLLSQLFSKPQINSEVDLKYSLASNNSEQFTLKNIESLHKFQGIFENKQNQYFLY